MILMTNKPTPQTTGQNSFADLQASLKKSQRVKSLRQFLISKLLEDRKAQERQERSTVPQQPERAESAEQTDIEDETGKPIKRIEIVHKLRQLATIYEKRMRLSAKRYRGEYHPKTQVIRVKSIEDIDALAHELGHYLQDVWEFDPSGNAELVRMGTELYADRADKMTQKRLAEEGLPNTCVTGCSIRKY